MFIYTFMTEKYIILNEISIPASELFSKYSLNFANFSLDILIKYILIKRKECITLWKTMFFSESLSRKHHHLDILILAISLSSLKLKLLYDFKTRINF